MKRWGRTPRLPFKQKQRETVMSEDPKSNMVEIATEEQLESYLIGKIDKLLPIKEGKPLKLVGNQVITPVGVIDILLKRGVEEATSWQTMSGRSRIESGSPAVAVVVELKAGTADESAVGQILKYIGSSLKYSLCE